MSSEYDEISETVTFQDLKKFLTIYEWQHQHQPMFGFNYGQPWRTIIKPLHNNLPQIIRKWPTSQCSTQSFDLKAGEHLH